jgi:putative ABC transport system ATP-binding protein
MVPCTPGGRVGLPQATSESGPQGSTSARQARGAVVEAVDVVKEYRTGELAVPVLHGVSLCVGAGELLAIMGPSGCGKSTLLHILGGIEAPTGGCVLLEGRAIGGLSDAERSIVRRRRMGFVFQKMNLLPTLSAVENVALPLRIDGVSRAAGRERALQALARVDLERRADHLPHELSGGEQQRVAVARALVTDPAVVFADEPTGALDSVNGRLVWDLLRECARAGQTVVVVTHDVALAEQSDRVVELRDGRVVGTRP